MDSISQQPQKSRPISKEEAQEMVALYLAGWTLRKIGRKFGCHHQAAKNALEQEGISKFKTRAEACRILTAEQDKEIAAAYLAGESAKSIGKRLGMSKHPVLQSLLRQGIIRRNHSEATTTAWKNHPRMLRVLSGKEEHDIVEKYMAGLSPLKLADEYDVDASTIRKTVERLGVVPRTASESRMLVAKESHPGNFLDLAGRKFGRLTVVKYLRFEKNRSMWLCECSCGQSKEVSTMYLCRGTTRSCGCWRSEKNSQRMRKHGYAGTNIYAVWSSMKRRCLNPKTAGYKNYGGRGIMVCQRWIDSFEDFICDVGLPPVTRCHLDRIDNDGDYEPGNVRWASFSVSARNKRNNRLLTANGETLCVTDWAKRLGVTPGCIINRIHSGWSVERAVTTPATKITYRNGSRRFTALQFAPLPP